MNINSKRILALVNLGLHIKNYSYKDPKYSKLDNCIEKSIILNKWFTRESITNALKSWAYTLESKNIEKWLSKYQYIGNKPRVIGLILAGNIPMVGHENAKINPLNKAKNNLFILSYKYYHIFVDSEYYKKKYS